MPTETTEARRRPEGAGRVPPHNLQAEESLLGAMLLSRDAIAAAVEITGASDFYKPAHGHVYEAIISLFGAGEPVDPVTVAEELSRAGLLDAIGGSSALVAIQGSTPATTSAGRYARIVEEHALLRRLIGVAGEIAELGYEVPDDVAKVVDRAESLVFEVAQRRLTETTSPIGELLSANLDRLEALYERGEGITGLPTGYTDLDELLNGLQPSNLVVVGARPSIGKTSFALGMATHAALHAQRPVLVFSLEMGQLEVSQRVLCSEARVDSSKVRTGRLSQADWTQLSHAVGRLAEAPLYIDDNPHVTVMEIRAKARRLKSKVGDLGLVIIDYVQLMTGRHAAESRQVEVSEISRSLKILARELESPVVALAQLNRALEQRADKRPMLSDLRESGCLTADTRLLRADTNTEVTLGDLVSRGDRDVPVWTISDDWRLTPSVLTHGFPSGVRPVYRLHLASGRTVDATRNHRFSTVDGWRELERLTVGDRLAVPRRLPAPEFIAPADPDEIVAQARRVHDSGDDIADSVFALPVGGVRGFLRAMWVAGGSVRSHSVASGPILSIRYDSPRRGVAVGVQQLLLRVGIPSRVSSVPRDGHRVAYAVRVEGAAHQQHFLDTVGSGAVDDDRRASLLLAATSHTGRPCPDADTVPCRVRPRVAAALQRARLSQRELAAALDEPYRGSYLLGSDRHPEAFSRDRLARIADVTGDKHLAALATSDVMWDRIIEVEPRGLQPVFDATVLGTHNFIANGVIAHNSLEQDSDVVLFLYRDEVYNPDTPDRGTAEILVAKHRSGPTGRVRLAWLDHYTKFANMAKGL